MTHDNEGNEDDTSSEQRPSVDVSEVDSSPDGLTSTDGSEEKHSIDEGDAGLSQDEWESLPANPDPSDDLGYRITAWECFHTADNSNQIIYMPDDESLLKEDAFIVAQEEVLCDLGDHC